MFYRFDERLELEIEEMQLERKLILECKKGSPHRRDLTKHYLKWYNELKDYCYFKGYSFKAICKYYNIKGL